MNMRQSFVDILRSSVDERRALFSAAASDLETRAENIEKDLYVCWELDFLFNRRKDDAIGRYFKGGTSLSKAYGLIKRFSEDIDVGIYKADLKVPLEADIAALRSVNQQQQALPSRWTRQHAIICPDRSSVCSMRKSPRSRTSPGNRDISPSISDTISTERRRRSMYWFWDTKASLTPAAVMSRRQCVSKAGRIPSVSIGAYFAPAGRFDSVLNPTQAQ